MLLHNRVITNNDNDSFLIYKSAIHNIRYGRSNLNLTIAPTMNCCFSCHYCFENHKKPGNISVEVMDAIMKYVQSIHNLQHINLTWFGGEPLMAPQEIEAFYDKLVEIVDSKIISSSIITTAYHINAEIVRILKKVGVTSMQITLDGLKETHNKIKNFEGSGDVFEKVMQNIEYLCKSFPELNIVLRVNLTKTNAHEYIKLVDLIMERFKDCQNVNPAPAFVLATGVSSCNQVCMSDLFNHRERSEYILDLAYKGYDSPYTQYPKMFFSECAMRNELTVAIDPEGYIYKCWEVIGNTDYAIGKLNQDGNVDDFNIVNFNRQTFGADPLEDFQCSKCKYLPICNGGCPIQRIQNKFEGGKHSYCSYYKGYMEEFLKIHILRKKREKLMEAKIKESKQ